MAVVRGTPPANGPSWGSVGAGPNMTHPHLSHTEAPHPQLHKHPTPTLNEHTHPTLTTTDMITPPHTHTSHSHQGLTMVCRCSRRGIVLLLFPLCIPELLSLAGRPMVLGFFPKFPVAPREGTPPKVCDPPYLGGEAFSVHSLCHGCSPCYTTLHVTLF